MRDRLRCHRLAGTGGTDQQDALGDPGTDVLEPGGSLQEVDDLADLEFDPVVAGDVVEGRRRTLGRVQLGLGATDGHDASHLALRLSAEVEEDGENEPERDDPAENPDERVGGGGDQLVVGSEGLECVELGVGHRIGPVGRVGTPVGEGAGDDPGGLVNRGGGDLLALDVAQEGVVGQGVGVALVEEAGHDKH